MRQAGFTLEGEKALQPLLQQQWGHAGAAGCGVGLLALPLMQPLALAVSICYCAREC